VTAGRPSGEAYVIFESREEALRALNLNMEKIGTRLLNKKIFKKKSDGILFGLILFLIILIF
jgi:hypothetical protein